MTTKPSLGEKWDKTPHARYKIGDKVYETRTGPNCKVCNSGFRDLIDEAIYSGYTIQTVLETVPEDLGLNARNIRDHHKNGHSGYKQATTISWLRHKAEEKGQDILEAVGSHIDGRILAEAVMIRTWELVSKGDINPTVGDGLSAAKFVQSEEIQNHGGSSDLEVIYEAFTFYHGVVTSIMTPAQREQYGRMITNNPFLNSLAQRAGAIDVEAVEDEDDGLLPAGAFADYEHPAALEA